MEITLILFGLILYFLPTIVGWNSNSIGGILILNLLLGWTIIGWIIALIWAYSVPQINKQDEHINELKKAKDRLDLGLLSQSDYDNYKSTVITKLTSKSKTDSTVVYYVVVGIILLILFFINQK